MAFCISTTHLPFQKVLPLIFIMSILLFLPSTHSIYFNYSEFKPNQLSKIKYISDAYPFNGVIQLTRNQPGATLNGSVGRAIYSDQVRIWDSNTGNLTDFKTHFSFVIEDFNSPNFGDGFTFFLTPNGSTIPSYAGGGSLGIYSGSNSSENQLVAVEFDTFKNELDPISNHVGININSRESLVSKILKGSFSNGSIAHALVSYSASTMNLSVFLSYTKNPVFREGPVLSYTVDLRKILPEWVNVGFSASTGKMVGLHQIHSWEFNSTLKVSVVEVSSTFGTVKVGEKYTWENGTDADNSTQESTRDDVYGKGSTPKIDNDDYGKGSTPKTDNDDGTSSTNSKEPSKENRKKIELIVGSVCAGLTLCLGGGYVLFKIKNVNISINCNFNICINCNYHPKVRDPMR